MWGRAMARYRRRGLGTLDHELEVRYILVHFMLRRRLGNELDFVREQPVDTVMF